MIFGQRFDRKHTFRTCRRTGGLKRNKECMVLHVYAYASAVGGRGKFRPAAFHLTRTHDHALDAHLDARVRDLLADPKSAILDIDREVAGILRDPSFPTEHFGVPLAGSVVMITAASALAGPSFGSLNPKSEALNV